jgi:hypothetical protein
MRGAPVMRPTLWDIPLEYRDLAGLSDQGIARTLSDDAPAGGGITSFMSSLLPGAAQPAAAASSSSSRAGMFALAAVGVLGLAYFMGKKK